MQIVKLSNEDQTIYLEECTRDSTFNIITINYHHNSLLYYLLFQVGRDVYGVYAFVKVSY